MLMYVDMAIDAIQATKSNWINTFVKEESVSKPLHDFVKSQTKFTKQVAKTFYDTTGAITNGFIDKTFSK